jgi:hypothetical protein
LPILKKTPRFPPSSSSSRSSWWQSRFFLQICARLCQAIRFVAVFALAFLATTIVLVPEVLVDLRRFPDLFEGVPSYLVNLPVAVVMTILALLLAIYVAGPIVRAKWSLDYQWPAISGVCLSIAALGIVAFGGSALIFQDNVIFDPTIAGNDLNVATLRAQSIYISKPIASAAMTTLDHNAWVQHAKIFYSMVRAIFYTLPEISILLIVLAAPLFLVLAYKQRRLFETHAKHCHYCCFFQPRCWRPIAWWTCLSIRNIWPGKCAAHDLWTLSAADWI